MTMQLMEKSHSPDGLLGWFTYERRNWAAAVVGAMALGFSWGNGHTTEGAISHISTQLGDKKAQVVVLQRKAACEHHVAAVASTVAKQAITGATSATVPIPDPKAIPADTCPH